MFGTADLSQSYDVNIIVGMVTNMTAGYIVAVLGYILFDDGIKAHRMKKQAEGAAQREKEYQKIARSVLRELAETQRLQQETEKEFGDADLVKDQLNRLRGTKQVKSQQAYRPAGAMASEFKQEQIDESRKSPNQHGGGQ